MAKSIDLHKANVTGLGAEKFAEGLIQHLLTCEDITINEIYLNKFASTDKKFQINKKTYVSYMLGDFSRIVEILCWRFYRSQKNDLLVLGDLPLNTSVKQYVLCHQSLIFKRHSTFSLRAIFNRKYQQQIYIG